MADIGNPPAALLLDDPDVGATPLQVVQPLLPHVVGFFLRQPLRRSSDSPACQSHREQRACGSVEQVLRCAFVLVSAVHCFTPPVVAISPRSTQASMPACYRSPRCRVLYSLGSITRWPFSLSSDATLTQTLYSDNHTL